MKLRDTKDIASTLVRLVNAAFLFTEEEATAVATIHPARQHVFSIDINGQEFIVTVTKAK